MQEERVAVTLYVKCESASDLRPVRKFTLCILLQTLNSTFTYKGPFVIYNLH